MTEPEHMTEVLIPSFVGGLGIRLWVEGDLALGRCGVEPEFFKPGTDRVRLGVLATLVDMVAGSPAHAIINPTVDLRVSLLEPTPTSGTIELVTYPVKAGRQLFIGETLLHTGDITRPFARSVCTFINKPLMHDRSDGIFPVGQLGHDNYDESLRLSEPSPGVFEMDNHEVVRNGANGTVQGGAQALLSEMAGERALDGLDGEFQAVDLEIRYLNRVRTGPVRATGELLHGGFDGRWVRAAIHEPPADNRIVSLTTLQFPRRPVSDSAVEPRWIDDDRALDELIKILVDEPAYGLDTEFLSERTYWPQLCLVQVSWASGLALVDPLACDVRALEQVLRAPSTMITHAGASDLPILERAVGARPSALFDVQLAAGFVGLGLPSLGSLVSALLDIRLDKSEQLADWSARPLSEATRKYAAADVEHLFPLTAELDRRLQDLGREKWAASECEHLRVTADRRIDPDIAWWKIKGSSSMRGEKARVAQSVAAWRERRAQQLDTLQRFVLPDLALAAVVGRPPKTRDQLFALRGVNRLPNDVARELLEAVEQGREMPKEQLRLPERTEDGPELDAAVALLVAYVAELARAEKIEKQLLATREDVKALVYGRPSRLDSGWRAEVAGDALRSLLDGKAVIRLTDKGRHLRLEQ